MPNAVNSSPTKYRPQNGLTQGSTSRKCGLTSGNTSAPGRIRTCDTGFRRAVLYPLSYEGATGSELTWPAWPPVCAE